MKQDIEIENEILQLLQDVDPTNTLRLETAQELAHHLADFTEAWAANSEDIDEYEHSLSQWIESNLGVDITDITQDMVALRNDGDSVFAEEASGAFAHYDEDDEGLAVAESE